MIYNKAMFLNRLKVERFLKSNNMKGQFFGITFTKKNGELRTLNGRLGIKSNGNGKKTVGKISDPYVTVYSNNDQGYRAVNLGTVKYITAFGNLYIVKG